MSPYLKGCEGGGEKAKDHDTSITSHGAVYSQGGREGVSSLGGAEKALKENSGSAARLGHGQLQLL